MLILTSGCRGISKVFTEAGVLTALLREPAEEFLVFAETVLVSGDAAGLGGTTGIWVKVTFGSSLFSLVSIFITAQFALVSAQVNSM